MKFQVTRKDFVTINEFHPCYQEILYTIFEWPYLPSSRLVLVGIANALDLTDRILPRLKLSVAISPTQLSFPPYTREEINKIITSRLKEAQGDSQV